MKTILKNKKTEFSSKEYGFCREGEEKGGFLGHSYIAWGNSFVVQYNNAKVKRSETTRACS